MNLRDLCFRSVPLILFVCVASGCGTRGYSRVTGKVVENGKPVTVSEKGVIQVALVPEGGDNTSGFGTTVKSDGTFVVNKRADGNFPSAGKYRVGVQVYDPYPGDDKYAGKFIAAKSPIIVEIKGDDELVVDVGK
jgi:hypothetical protein